METGSIVEESSEQKLFRLKMGIFYTGDRVLVNRYLEVWRVKAVYPSGMIKVTNREGTHIGEMTIDPSGRFGVEKIL